MERIAGGVAHRVLHEKGHAAERRVGRGQGARFLARAVEALVDDRVEGRVQCFDAPDRGVDQLQWGGLATRDELGLRCGVEPSC